MPNLGTHEKKLIVYTRKAANPYLNENYPGVEGDLRDLNESIHFAIYNTVDGCLLLNNNTGIIFAQADYRTEIPEGITKTLIDPWLFRTSDGRIAICAVEKIPIYNKLSSCITIFVPASDFSTSAVSQIHVSTSEIRRPSCTWNENSGQYTLSWEENSQRKYALSTYLKEVTPLKDAAPLSYNEEIEKSSYLLNKHTGGDFNPGNCINITELETDILKKHFCSISNISVDNIDDMYISKGDYLSAGSLPKATCRYTDGSTHKKNILWEDIDKVNTSVPGTYTVHGEIRCYNYKFPLMNKTISDPFIFRYQDKWYMTCTQNNSVAFKVSDTIEGLENSEFIEVYRINEGKDGIANIWAQEMHFINNVPYIFTTVGLKGWTSVHCNIFKCTGDILNPADWEAPHLVQLPNGKPLDTDDDISLDMTYFEDNGVHYVMWSARKIVDKTENKEIAEPADIRIATINPDRPWELTSEPQLIIKPLYGWDRCQSQVDEGPYMIRHNGNLFVTISGSSTALPDLYCMGLLKAKEGSNLLNPSVWTWYQYPILTKESVPNQLGPGHNMFVEDPNTGDTLFVFHAVQPNAEISKDEPQNLPLVRRMGVRRLHWSDSGLPYLALTPEQDLNPKFKKVSVNIHVQEQ